MVIKTHRAARPLLALAAIAGLALVALPSASIADTIPGAYFSGPAPDNQPSTLEDAGIAVGIGSLLWLLFHSA